MKNKALALAQREKAPDTAFEPVPVRHRYDGWTPERQRGFIQALAETASTTRAARIVNMSVEGAYALRRHPQAASFRRAWEAALDLGVPRLKDLAFERAVEGELVPVFSGGKLAGYRRRYNDRLLMFCLRHYGQDSSGRRTTINYFSTKASAGAKRPSTLRPGSGQASLGTSGEGAGSEAQAEAGVTVLRTVSSGGAQDGAARADAAAAVVEGFAGVALDAEAKAEIDAALLACAARARARRAAIEQGGDEGVRAALDDPEQGFVRTGEAESPAWGQIEWDGGEEWRPFHAGEGPWEQAGAPLPEWGQQWLRERSEAEAVPSLAEPVRGTARPGNPAGEGNARPQE